MLGKFTKKGKKVQEHSTKNNSDSQNNNKSSGSRSNDDKFGHLTVAVNQKGGAALNYLLKKAPNFLPTVVSTAKLLPKISKKDKKNKHGNHNTNHHVYNGYSHNNDNQNHEPSIN